MGRISVVRRSLVFQAWPTGSRLPVSASSSAPEQFTDQRDHGHLDLVTIADADLGIRGEHREQVLRTCREVAKVLRRLLHHLAREAVRGELPEALGQRRGVGLSLSTTAASSPNVLRAVNLSSCGGCRPADRRPHNASGAIGGSRCRDEVSRTPTGSAVSDSSRTTLAAAEPRRSSAVGPMGHACRSVTHGTCSFAEQHVATRMESAASVQRPGQPYESQFDELPGSAPLSSFALVRTASSMGGVSLPVKVFCWLTW